MTRWVAIAIGVTMTGPAERRLAARFRVAVPPSGFGSRFNVMREWLDYHASRYGYFTSSERVAGRQDATLFYFVDAKMAAALVDRFACG